MSDYAVYCLVASAIAAAAFWAGHRFAARRRTLQDDLQLATRDQLICELYNRPPDREAWIIVTADTRTGDLKTIFAIGIPPKEMPRLLLKARKFLRDNKP